MSMSMSMSIKSQKQKILRLLHDYSSIFTNSFFHKNINDETITLNSSNFKLDHQVFLHLLHNQMDSMDVVSTHIHELLYIILFIAKLRSYFHVSDEVRAEINIRLVYIENIFFTLLLEAGGEDEPDMDELICITNSLSSGKRKSSVNTSQTKHTSCVQRYINCCCFCLCINNPKIAPTPIFL
jgi:hypothetical protein